MERMERYIKEKKGPEKRKLDDIAKESGERNIERISKVVERVKEAGRPVAERVLGGGAVMHEIGKRFFGGLKDSGVKIQSRFGRIKDHVAAQMNTLGRKVEMWRLGKAASVSDTLLKVSNAREAFLAEVNAIKGEKYMELLERVREQREEKGVTEIEKRKAQIRMLEEEISIIHRGLKDGRDKLGSHRRETRAFIESEAKKSEFKKVEVSNLRGRYEVELMAEAA